MGQAEGVWEKGAVLGQTEIGFRSHEALSPATFEPTHLQQNLGIRTVAGLTVCSSLCPGGQ